MRLTAMVLALLLIFPAAAHADDYNDPDYRDYDVDLQMRGNGRQPAQLTDPEFGQAFLTAGADSWLDDMGQAIGDADDGRVYTGGARYVPGGSAGDPRYYYDVTSTEIAFIARTGAKLTGHVWAPIGAPGERPGVVITSGSIQGYEAMYFWAARDLARNGYIVLSWDAQGQGRSEGIGHDDAGNPTMDGVPFQQSANFVEATVDAVQFFLSTPDAEYLPQGMSEEGRERLRDADEQVDFHNPLFGLLDADNIGLAGHSLGGTGAGEVQQCSDEGDVWETLELCDGRSYPIRAVVGWDGLPSSVTPVVPGMDQSADGYFFNTTPQTSAPAQDANLGPFNAWVEAGLDAYSITVRGGTHLEWCDMPYALPATTYGTQMATYYTTAWFDAHLAPETDTQAQALDDLQRAPSADADMPWSGHNLSGSRLSAYRMTLPGPGNSPGTIISVDDLRAANGWAPVGEWAAINAEITAGGPAGS